MLRAQRRIGAHRVLSPGQLMPGKLVTRGELQSLIHELDSLIPAPHLAVIHPLGHECISQAILDKLDQFFGSRGFRHSTQSLPVEIHSITVPPGGIGRAGFLNLLHGLAHRLLAPRRFLSSNGRAICLLGAGLRSNRQCH